MQKRIFFKKNYTVKTSILPIDVNSTLEEITIDDDVTSIVRSNNKYYTNLKKINFNSKLEFIDGETFSYTQLEEINFPSSLNIIDSGAFSECHKLKKITFNNIPSNIYKSSFYHCNNLRSICIRNNNKEIIVDIPEDYTLKSITSQGITINIEYYNNYESINTIINSDLSCTNKYSLLSIKDDMIDNNVIIMPDKYNKVSLSDVLDSNKGKNINTFDLSNTEKIEIDMNYIQNIKKIILPNDNEIKIIIRHVYNDKLTFEIPSNKTNLLEEYKKIYEIDCKWNVYIYKIEKYYIICTKTLEIDSITFILDENLEYLGKVNETINTISEIEEILNKNNSYFDKINYFLNQNNIDFETLKRCRNFLNEHKASSYIDEYEKTLKKTKKGVKND